MSYLDRIRAARHDYLERLQAEYTAAKARYPRHALECLFELPDPEDYASAYYTVDIGVLRDDAERKLIEINSEEIDLEGEFQRPGGQQLRFKGFAWSSLDLRPLDGPAEAPQAALRPWFDKWIGDGGPEGGPESSPESSPNGDPNGDLGEDPADDGDFAGVIHNLGFHDDHICVDLGSAPVEALEELLDALAEAGVKTIEIAPAFEAEPDAAA